MFEIVITGRFMTGSTQDNENEARETAVNLLKEKLSSAGCLDPHDLFQFELDSVEAKEL